MMKYPLRSRTDLADEVEQLRAECRDLIAKVAELQAENERLRAERVEVAVRVKQIHDLMMAWAAMKPLTINNLLENLDAKTKDAPK